MQKYEWQLAWSLHGIGFKRKVIDEVRSTFAYHNEEENISEGIASIDRCQQQRGKTEISWDIEE